MREGCWPAVFILDLGGEYSLFVSIVSDTPPAITALGVENQLTNTLKTLPTLFNE